MADCIFCKIATGEMKATVTYQNDTIVAIQDINPQAPVHQLIIPKRHIANLMDLGEGEGLLLDRVFAAANTLAAQYGLSRSGFRIIVNCGRDGGQTVDHLHFHLLGGRPMRWPPG